MKDYWISSTFPFEPSQILKIAHGTSRTYYANPGIETTAFDQVHFLQMQICKVYRYYRLYTFYAVPIFFFDE
jgi:hypothetical protein